MCSFKLKPTDADELTFKIFDKERFKESDDEVCTGEFRLSTLHNAKDNEFNSCVNMFWEGKNVGQLEVRVKFVVDEEAVKAQKLVS